MPWPQNNMNRGFPTTITVEKKKKTLQKCEASGKTSWENLKLQHSLQNIAHLLNQNIFIMSSILTSGFRVTRGL